MSNNENFDFFRFYESLNDQLVLAKNRFKGCEDNEDDYGASSEAGFYAGIMKAIELFQKYCPAGLLHDCEREKFYTVQKMYCKLNARDDGWIYCSDCINHGNCEWRNCEWRGVQTECLEYCERFVRKKDNCL